MCEMYKKIVVGENAIMSWRDLEAKFSGSYVLDEVDRKKFLAHPDVNKADHDKDVKSEGKREAKYELREAAPKDKLRICADYVREHVLRSGPMPLDVLEFDHHIKLTDRLTEALNKLVDEDALPLQKPVCTTVMENTDTAYSGARASLVEWMAEYPYLLEHVQLFPRSGGCLFEPGDVRPNPEYKVAFAPPSIHVIFVVCLTNRMLYLPGCHGWQRQIPQQTCAITIQFQKRAH